ncbi:MAG: hypothetical protein KAR79_02785, partial [Simkaniaceae bacterium]|nr:hypothetical protein [Simkaniaceae bacterium]
LLDENPLTIDLVALRRFREFKKLDVLSLPSCQILEKKLPRGSNELLRFIRLPDEKQEELLNGRYRL